MIPGAFGSEITKIPPMNEVLRRHKGERHTVTVVPGGYVWREATYPSLSTIARAITGTAWSGPRFFGWRAGVNGPGEMEGEHAPGVRKPVAY
jgi:hypothetical protein